MMIEIFKEQAEAQREYSRLMGIVDPITLPGQPVGVAVEYIHGMQRHLNSEIEELLEEVAGGRSELKPWSGVHKAAMQVVFAQTELMRFEAVDALLFCINVCLSVGLTHENINVYCHAVHSRNKSRRLNEYLGAPTSPSAVDQWIDKGSSIDV